MRKALQILQFTTTITLSIVLLVIVVLRLTRYSDQLLYKTNGSEYSKFESDLNFEEFTFQVEDSVTLHGVLFKPDSTEAIATIFHFSGKGMHLMSSIQKSYKPLLEQGFQVFCYERRDFGMSNGEADNSLVIQEDALFVFDEFLKYQDISAKPLIIWGQSLGGAFATMIASERQDSVDGLILEGTFSSFPDIGKVYAGALNLENFKWIIPLIMNDDFPAEKSIKSLTIPTTIIHSKTDDQVPYYLGEKLFQAANKENTKYWPIESKHIMGIYDYEEEYLAEFFEMLQGKQNNLSSED